MKSPDARRSFCEKADQGVEEDATGVAADAGGVLSSGQRFLVDTSAWIETVDHTSYRSYYAHLSAVVLQTGAAVSATNQVGTGGTTGNSSGPHLHFEVRRDVGGGAAGSGASCPYWYSSSTAGHGGSMWWTYSNGGGGADYRARWTPSLPYTATYEAQVHIPNYNATSHAVRYFIQYNGGSRTVVVDQHDTYGPGAGRWISLGRYPFAAGSAGYVEVSDATYIGSYTESGTAYQIGVDAAQFVRN
jgi:hypothetical protein